VVVIVIVVVVVIVVVIVVLVEFDRGTLCAVRLQGPTRHLSPPEAS
jgi:hypothetical protein